MEWWWIVVAAIVLAMLVVASGKGHQTDSQAASYDVQPQLFSPAERSFYGVLSRAASDQFVVFGKVRVTDVLKPKRGGNRSQWQSAFNKISAKHFDFVLCDPDTLTTSMVIELHDRSHRRSKRAIRDEFLRNACSGAGMRYLEFDAKEKYVVADVRNRLKDVAADV